MENKIRYQFERLPMVLFLACLTIAVVAGTLQQHDVLRDGFKLFKITKPLVLSCNSTTNENEKIVWSKMVEDEKLKKVVLKNVKDLVSDNFKPVIKGKEGVLFIEKTRDEDEGNYTCSLNNESHTFNVYAAVLVKLPENMYVIEEEKLEITCLVKGTNPSISWEFRPENSNETVYINEDDERMKLQKVGDVESARLVIEKAALSDRGMFICIGKNDLMEDSVKSEGFLRVKDKLAALWPFLGIVAEVFVLCAIIFIYENRRNKTDLDESDTDQSPDQKEPQDAR